MTPWSQVHWEIIIKTCLSIFYFFYFWNLNFSSDIERLIQVFWLFSFLFQRICCWDLFMNLFMWSFLSRFLHRGLFFKANFWRHLRHFWDSSKDSLNSYLEFYGFVTGFWDSQRRFERLFHKSPWPWNEAFRNDPPNNRVAVWLVQRFFWISESLWRFLERLLWVPLRLQNKLLRATNIFFGYFWIEFFSLSEILSWFFVILGDSMESETTDTVLGIKYSEVDEESF